MYNNNIIITIETYTRNEILTPSKIFKIKIITNLINLFFYKNYLIHANQTSTWKYQDTDH